MRTLLRGGTDERKERYLRPMCDGKLRSCFAMTEPRVAGQVASAAIDVFREEGTVRAALGVLPL